MLHVAIIMDGNGRWAASRHLPRTAGHRAGALTAQRIIEEAARQGIDTLTLYAFSADNWQRPQTEVNALLALLRHQLLAQTRRCLEQSIRINIIGRRDRLTPGLCRTIQQSEQATAHCSGMHLRIAIDYSASRSVVAAGQRISGEKPVPRARFLELLAQVDHCPRPARDVDLLIRTGGERRLSDFLLYESAYAELHFVDCLWPDFDEEGFRTALAEYARRDRRFGQIRASETAVHDPGVPHHV
jgi:undecaprenyl diphosphate synthase